jgi:hypothetical protein
MASLPETRSRGVADDRWRAGRSDRLESLQSGRVFLPALRPAANSMRHCPTSSATIERTNMFLTRVLSTFVATLCLVSAVAVTAVQAQSATEIQLSYKDKKFDPAEINAPANTPIVIKLRNLDAKAMEFESKTLKVEKVVAASSDATINVRAQKPGRYEFFDEYNEKVARGALVVK